MNKRIAVMAVISALGLANTACTSTSSVDGEQHGVVGSAVVSTGNAIGSVAKTIFGVKDDRDTQEEGKYVYIRDSRGRLHRRYVGGTPRYRVIRKETIIRRSSNNNAAPIGPGQSEMKQRSTTPTRYCVYHDSLGHPYNAPCK